jgi:HNH endonuclease
MEDRFWSCVDRRSDGTCWPWLRSIVRDTGYGQFSIDERGRKRKVKAHRMAFELLRGPILAGFQVHHRCGVKTCCNPAHMELMTRSEHGRLSREEQVRTGRHNRRSLRDARDSA